MFRKIIFLISILISILILSISASAYPFLTKSKLLKQLGAQILVGENQEDAIVFDKDILKEYNVPTDGKETYLITSNGLISMEGKTTNKQLYKMCTDPYPGIGFKKVNNDGIFIATGINVNGSISWYPAKNVEQENIRCFNNLEMKNPKYSFYKSGILQGIIKQARWSKEVTNKEIETKCKEFAEYNAQINQQTSVDNLYEKCISDGDICKNEERLIVTYNDSLGGCKEITNCSIDCDGQTSNGHNLQEFFGTMVIKIGSKQEIWLIWNAPGYEGDGIYAIEINDLGKKEKPSEEWLVYNGC